MQPNRTQTHIDKPLTDFAIGFLQNPSDFVAGTVLPTKTVSKQSDRYFKYSAADFARDDAKQRQAGEESVGSGYSLSNDTYFADKYALHKDISYDDIANADAPIDLERDAVEFLSHQMLIRHEKLFAAACWTTGIWGSDVSGSGTTQWSDYLGSSPIQVIDQAKRGVHLKTFKTPNTLILGQDVFLALKEHPDFVSRIQYTSQDSIDEVLIAKRLGVEQVKVAKGVLNSASEGLAASMGFLLDPKSALLIYTPPSIGTMTAAAAVNFAWTGAPHLPRPMGVAARRFDDDKTQCRRVEMEICKDVKVTGSELGVFFNGIVV
jgi:hypothetical protein